MVSTHLCHCSCIYLYRRCVLFCPHVAHYSVMIGVAPEHSMLAASHTDDDDSDGHSDRKNCGSDSDDEREEGDVHLNSMMALVFCPQYDWRCSTCDKCVNEVDKSRRWVDPRPCPKCKKPMETWRTRESICPIFKPEGSAPSPRELKVHGVPLPRATGVPLKRCEQPNCLRWANNGFDSCCAACPNPSLEQPAHTVQCGQRQDALQARVQELKVDPTPQPVSSAS